MRHTLIAVCLFSVATLGHAALGSLPTPTTAGVTAGPNILKAASNTSYSVKSSTLPTGTTVKEFVGSDGYVFAVTWEGPFIPNLKELLGDHFTALTAKAASRPMAGNSQVSVNLPEVVIQSGGHMRAVNGRAWIPTKLPAGVTPDYIQ